MKLQFKNFLLPVLHNLHGCDRRHEYLVEPALHCPVETYFLSSDLKISILYRGIIFASIQEVILILTRFNNVELAFSPESQVFYLNMPISDLLLIQTFHMQGFVLIFLQSLCVIPIHLNYSLFLL